MAEDVSLQQLVDLLPPRIWYLTSNGPGHVVPPAVRLPVLDRARAPRQFAKAMGTDEKLFAIGLDLGALISDEMLDGLRNTRCDAAVHRPVDRSDSGDVHGKILRLTPLT